MTQEEFYKIGNVIKSSYPASKLLEDKGVFLVWYSFLKDFDKKVVENAVIEHISNSKFPPTIAELREYCTARTKLQIPTFDEARAEANKLAMDYGVVHIQEAFDNMSPMTYAVIKNLGWRKFCTDENETALRANFRDIYNLKRDEAVKNQRLPQDAYRDKMSLTAKTELNKRLKESGGLNGTVSAGDKGNRALSVGTDRA